MHFGSRTSCLIALWSIGASLSSFAQQYQHIHAYRRADLPGSKFGWCMSSVDEHLAVGLPHALGQRGVASVYTSPDLAWSVVEGDTLGERYPSPPLDQRFAANLAMGPGPMLAVGSCSAYGTDQYCNTLAQWVSVYVPGSEGWEHAQTIAAPEEAEGTFGKALVVTAEEIFVGGSRLTANGFDQDVVLIYERNGDFVTPVPVDTLVGIGITAEANAGFGHALSLHDDLLMVGASGDDELGTDCGAVYLFGRDQGGANAWGLIRKIIPSNGAAGDRFGAAVAVEGDHGVVGAPGHRINGSTTGAVYFFNADQGSPGNWGEVADFTPIEPVANMQYGASVALSEDRAAVGAPLHAISPNGTDGSVEVFTYSNGAWSFNQRIIPWYDGHVSQVSRSGTALLFTQERLLIGAPFAIVDGTTASPTGAVLVYGDPASGLGETITERGLVIAPDPISDQAVLRSSLLDGPVVVEIVDVTGRVCRSERITAHGTWLFSRADLKAGSYTMLLRHATSTSLLGATRFIVE